jgi:anhydro-N-acetylmuramic acid kinase
LDRYSFSGDFVEGLSLEDGAATLLAFTVGTISMAETLLPKARVKLVAGLWWRAP